MNTRKNNAFSMKSVLLCQLISLFFVQSASAAVTVTKNTPQRFSFSWRCDSIGTITIHSTQGTFTSLELSGGNISIENSGEPVRPGYSFTVGIPQKGAVSASVTALKTRSLQLTHPVAITDPRKKEQPNTFLSPWISEPRYTRLRSLRAATFVFSPIRISESNKSIIWISEGTCTVTFPPAEHRPHTSVPTNDYEKTLHSLVKNYDIAKGWRARQGLFRKKVSTYPLPPSQKSYRFSIGDGHDGFNESTIHENGVLKITGSRIQEMFGTVAPGDVRLYASHKGMLPDSIPGENQIPDGVFEIPLLRINNSDDNTVDEEDYFIGYVSGTSDWVAGNQRYKFTTNVYTDYRTYWLTVRSGKELNLKTVEQPAPSSSQPLSSVLNYVHFKQSKKRRDDDHGSRDWLWKIFTHNQNSAGYTLDLPRLDTDAEGSIVFEGSTRNRGYLNISMGGKTLDTMSTLYDSVTVSTWGDRKLTFDFVGKTDTSKVMLDYFTVHYQQHLTINDEATTLTVLPPPADSGTVTTYELTVNTRQRVYILRADEHEHHIALIDTFSMKKDGIHRFTDSAFGGRRYIICNESGLLSLPETTPPPAPTKTSMQITDLRTTSHSSDFIIISPTAFIAAADSLARHKKNIGFKNPVVVDINDVYRYFSGGNKDAVAIRNFLAYTTRHWDHALFPDYVILFGTGHYDAKNIAHSAEDFIPPYISGSNNYENFFTLLTPKSADEESSPSIALGRFPCLTVDHAWSMVAKVVETEDPAVADFSEWRNRALFVADDDMQGMELDAVATSKPHHKSSDLAASVIDSLSPSIDLRKVYLFEYESDQLLQKPGASIALINEINNGVGYINFFGHGADITWTDEYILTAEMVSRMNNRGHYPVVSAFSCSVGRFDLPGEECLSGVLARSAGIGSIASISSTREAYAHANEELAIKFYSILFDSTSSQSIGYALISAQVDLRSSSHRTYCILGDPSIRAIRPTRSVKLSFKDNGDTLKALQKLTVNGSIRKADGSIDRSFSGSGAQIALGLFNAPEQATRKDGKERAVSYTLPGTPLFLGKTSLHSGTFTQTMLIPQNLTFDRDGVKMTAYAWKEGSSLSGTGAKTDIVFHGSVTSRDTSDNAGPAISIRPSYDNDRLSGGNASFSEHITVQVPFTAELELFDTSGIDAAGTGPDEGITIEIDELMPRQNINSKFQFKEGDYRRGIVSVVYDEKVLKPGDYTMTVTARDQIGNLAKKSFNVTVTTRDDLSLAHVINYPNPARYGTRTRFYFHTTYTSETYWGNEVQLTVKIYTLGGRLVRVIKDARNGEIWDLRDQQGHPLSPDIYLYQVIGEDYGLNKTVKSNISKLVIAPPR